MFPSHDREEEDNKDIPGFEGTLDKLNDLTSEFSKEDTNQPGQAGKDFDVDLRNQIKEQLTDSDTPRYKGSRFPSAEMVYNLNHDSETKTKVEQVISMLKEMEVDGETMQHILEEIGMDEQMFNQLSFNYPTEEYIGAPGNKLV